MRTVTLGERLRMLRQKKSKSIEEAAHDLEISFSLLAMYERDERVPPTHRLIRMAEYYGTTVAYLLGEVDVPDREALQVVALHYSPRRDDPTAPLPDHIRRRIREIQDELGRLVDEIDETQAQANQTNQ